MNQPASRATLFGASSFVPLGVVFFLSGVPALLYQLCWQRMLFTVYGVNIESITVVVSAFMLGLGLGSLGGGRLTRQTRFPPLLLFCSLEFAIAAFGLVSPSVFHWIFEVTLGASLLTTALLSFSLVVFPTVLMGASLPLLVAHLLSRSKNMGRAVGLLYFVNTLGSAAACFLATSFTFPRLGLTGTIWAAALLNGLVAAGALAVHLRTKNAFASDETSPIIRKTHAKEGQGESQTKSDASPANDLLSFRLVLLLAALSGFISLSYEVTLARAYSFVAEGRASAFPLLLGWYLFGIALGSFVSGLYCARSTATKAAQLRTIGIYFLLVNLLGYATIPWIARVAVSSSFENAYPLAALLSGGLGAILPLVTHVGIAPNERAAERLSYVYVANIVGSTAGSLMTGFWAMDFFTVSDLVLGLSVLGTVCTLPLFLSRANAPQKMLYVAFTAATIGALAWAKSSAYHHLYERLLWKEEYNSKTRPFRHIVENRHGVVTVTRGGMVFGGGIYDGQLSTDLVYDRNSIVRPYIVSALHPRPARVLVIGLSTGAWTQVLLHHPQVESLTAVEINPGYLEVIRRSDAVKSILENPKLKIVIDDGRRWLSHHPEERFDLIVMNTTFHWHAYAANLLSREFLTDVKSHLHRDGIAIYNTTSSEEAQRTGALVFPHALRFMNNMYVSPSPLVLERSRLKQVLVDYAIDGTKVFDLENAHHRSRLEHTLGLLDHFTTPPDFTGFERRSDVLVRTQGVRVITDDNMGTEWTHDFSKEL